MKVQNARVNFTERDFMILESYKTVIDGLADYLGEGYEMVLHSLHNLDHSVIKIINGHYSGRKEGAPITDLALSMLAKIEEQQGSSYISYFNQNKKGEPLKAATITIRGEKNKVIGLLCINFYLNTPIHLVLQSFFSKGESVKGNITSENFVENVDELIQEAVEEAQHKVQNDPNITSVNKNKEIVHELYQKGIFNLKDAVIKVAEQMQISKNTVYLHVRNFSNRPV